MIPDADIPAAGLSSLMVLTAGAAPIIRGGFKIRPDAIVRACEAHPAVREAVVAAMPDERLLPYRLPTAIRFVEDVPRTGSMKPILPEIIAPLFRVGATAT